MAAARRAPSAEIENLVASLSSRQVDLARSDAAAQQLLESSEALVARLSERAGQRPVGLLAQVTRLRLLSQRLAKEGLLAQVQPGHDLAGVADVLVVAVRLGREEKRVP